MATQAVEFTTLPHDGVIDLPKELQNLSGQPLRVIVLLDDAKRPVTPKRFPDLSAFRRRLPPAKTSSAKLICSLRDEENVRY